MIKIILYMLLNISYNNAYIYPNKYILKQSYEIDFNLYKKDIEYIEERIESMLIGKIAH